MRFSLTLAVADLQRSAEFYREVAGLPAEIFVPAAGHPVLLLRCGETVILFRQTQVMEALHPALFQNLERHPRGVGVSLEFQLPDLEPVLRAVARRRLPVLYDLEDDEHRRREIWLHDPDGYLLVLQQEEDT
ncbi:MAG: VOC family protein [Desulfuromonadales bacterium]|nr:VOC family protein [Desulfuromonadales bacterium]